GPLVDPRLDPQRPANAHLFFSIYFLITGVHAVHVLAGMGVITAFMVLARRRRLDFTTIDLGGLYWHFVDIVWIFIFPALYLIG
ncbi:MAG: cytochrome c oxidase subunit 3, partial [Planctomycetota bacterium]